MTGNSFMLYKIVCSLNLFLQWESLPYLCGVDNKL